MFLVVNLIGELAQLARAPALHVGGHRFDSDILHKSGKKMTQVIGSPEVSGRYSPPNFPRKRESPQD